MADHDIGEMEVNAVALAKILGLSRPRITQLTEKGIFEKAGARRYNLVKNVQAYLEMSKKSPSKIEANYERARAEKMQYQADLEGLKLKTRQGQLVEIDTVEDVVKAEYAIVRQRLFSIPNIVTMDMLSAETPQQVHEPLLAALNEALDELKFDTTRVDTRSETDESEGTDFEVESEADVS